MRIRILLGEICLILGIVLLIINIVMNKSMINVYINGVKLFAEEEYSLKKDNLKDVSPVYIGNNSIICGYSKVEKITDEVIKSIGEKKLDELIILKSKNVNLSPSLSYVIVKKIVEMVLEVNLNETRNP